MHRSSSPAVSNPSPSTVSAAAPRGASSRSRDLSSRFPARSPRSQAVSSGSPAASSRSSAPRTMSRAAVRRSFLVLQELESKRVSKRARYHNHPLPPSEGNEDSPHPLLDAYKQTVGMEGVMKLSNFTPTEISRLWSSASDYMSTRWNTGRDNKCKYPPVDVLFMTLCVLKNGGHWDVLASSYEIKAPTFEKMVIKFLSRSCTSDMLTMRSMNGQCGRWCCRVVHSTISPPRVMPSTLHFSKQTCRAGHNKK